MCFQICKNYLCVLALLSGIALAAENRAIVRRLERNLCLFAALCASGGEEFAGALTGVLASVAASLATLGLILEALLCVELLLTCGENEFLTAILAN